MNSEYWRSERGLENITPQGKLWPEGDDFSDVLIGLIGAHSVVEFGCGVGRLAGCFDPAQYLGVDISARAVAAARTARPGYRFEVVADHEPVPVGGVTLAHTVLLHIGDDEISAVAARFTSDQVIVSEILGRKWRRDGLPPVFNREVEDYERAFAPNYKLMGHNERPYPHYTNTNLSLLEFSRC